MSNTIPYIISAINTCVDGGKYWLSICLQLKDNSLRRMIAVGAIQILRKDGTIVEEPFFSGGSLTQLSFVGGSEVHRQTRYSVEIQRDTFELLQEQGTIKFCVLVKDEAGKDTELPMQHEERDLIRGNHKPDLNMDN